MQVQDAFSVPRRALDVEDYIDIARRHKGWIFGPLFAAVVISVVGAFLWPDTYVSTATIKVIPQVVPEAYVQSNVNQAMSDRISAIAQTVLSRPVLTSIITTYELYPRERLRMPMEDIVEEMRRDIKIGNVLNVASTKDRVPAFQIQYSYTDRYKAQKVVMDLLSKFIDTNQRERSSSSLSTTQLLKDQVDIAKKRLDEVESKLADFRSRHQGQLPDEMAQNMQQAAALQGRSTALNAALSRVNQEKIMMESELRIYRDRLAALNKDISQETSGSTYAKSDRMAEAEREVRQLEDQLAVLRQHYKETHPDVQRTENLLSVARKKKEQIGKEEDAARKSAPERAASPQTVREMRDLEGSIRRVQSQIEAKGMESDEYRRELGKTDSAVKAYQSRLEGVPASQKEYGDLLRDSELAKAQHAELEQKMNRALLAQDMENRKAGENLEPLDPPSLPQTPTQPKRPVVVAMGSLAGLVLGVMFAAVREVKDTSLKNLKDVRAYTKLPILGSVPLLENDLVVKRRRRFAWFAWSLACLTGIVVMSGSIIYYYVTKV
ncbi:MAG: hypothetical protein JSU00_20640 [Acidobacteria bacterium]|nr:hypothetical protein [Acidobacteriota bacterium]